MGRTALYRDPVPYRPARAEVHLESDALQLVMPDGDVRWHALDGVLAATSDGFVQEPLHHAERLARGSSELIPRTREVVAQAPRMRRRFVRMLVIARPGSAGPRSAPGGSAELIERTQRHHTERVVVITPPEQGAVAPGVVHMPEAPSDAAIVEHTAWEALADWLVGGGRLSACSISDLARLASIATPQFAVLIGEVAAQRALEYVWAEAGPLRGGFDLESALQPLTDAARTSPRAGEALVSALSHAAGARRRRRAR